MAARIQQLLLEAQSWFDEKVDGIDRSQWNLSTPCSEWNVRQLVHHLVDENQWIPFVLAGDQLDAAAQSVASLSAVEDEKQAWKRASTDAARAIETLIDTQTTVHLSFGDVPADVYLWQLFGDHLVHGWDLAHATRQDEAMPDELLNAAFEWFIDQEATYRAAGVIARRAVEPPNAGRQQELLVMFGRDPLQRPDA